MKKIILAVLVSAVFFCVSAITLKLGSLAPQNSPWDDALREMVDDWKKISNGSIQVKIYAGGIAGDERDMLRKVKIKQLDIVAMTGVGMADVYKGILTVQIPMMYNDEDEFWHILEKMKPFLEKKIEESGFKVLLWSKVGWVYFFSKQPIINPVDLQRQKMFIYSGDADAAKIWKTMGFQPVPLSTNDIMTSLQSGMIDAVIISPLTAAAYQWFGAAPNMSDMKWAPLLGGIVVSLDIWNKIPVDTRKKLEESAEKIGRKMQSDIDQADYEALQIMQTYGLKVSNVPPNAIEQWKVVAEKGIKTLIGTTIEPQSYEQVKKYLEEYRAGKK